MHRDINGALQPRWLICGLAVLVHASRTLPREGVESHVEIAREIAKGNPDGADAET